MLVTEAAFTFYIMYITLNTIVHKTINTSGEFQAPVTTKHNRTQLTINSISSYTTKSMLYYSQHSDERILTFSQLTRSSNPPSI